MYRVAVHTSWGDVQMTLQGRRVQEIRLPLQKAPLATRFEVAACRVARSPELEEDLRQQLQTYFQLLFAGRPCPSPAVVEPSGSRFSLRVWEEIRQIPRGEVRSYGELARILGQPGAARAVGRACGANPLPLIIPCHRVIAADGSLGGFSCGMAWKQLLLQAEGPF